MLAGAFVVSVIIGACSASVHFFQPPSLNIQESYLNSRVNNTLEIGCTGKHAVYWKLPETTESPTNDSRLSIVSSRFETSYKSKLQLRELASTDTGFYSCYYNGTTNFESLDNVTSLYVFVNDPVHLFVERTVDLLIILMQQYKKSIIPCLLTSSSANVSLWKTDGEDEQVSLSTDLTFDPTVGFVVHYPTVYFSGLFQCRAQLGRTSQEINVMLVYLPDTYHDPQPYIDRSGAKQPIINGTFYLNCSVNVDPGTRVFFHWSYPNENETTDGRIEETRAVSRQKTRRNYVHVEVSSSLVVHRAQGSDSGDYVCSVTDHARKTGVDQVSLLVHASEQPAHVNFSSDVDLSRPLVHEAGEDIRVVIAVHAYPDIQAVKLEWTKDGETLTFDARRRSATPPSTNMALEIDRLKREDSGTYVLYGRTKDSEASIAFRLEVKDKPMVWVHNVQPVYTLRREYVFECEVDGYPPPVVWWRWKACKRIERCDAGAGRYGWTDVETGGPNAENVTLEYTVGATFSQVSRMHLTANVSGHYACTASSVMGKAEALVSFIVTDAENGFEISATNKRPVDGDSVNIKCKANTFNYTRLEWRWRPITNSNVLVLQDTSEISIRNSSSNYSHSSIVSFRPIRLNMSGEYECIAFPISDDPTSSKHLSLDVIKIRRPFLNNTNMRGGIIIAATASLQELYCYAEGLPSPVMWWKKDGSPISSGNSSGIRVSESGRRITILDVVPDDAGLYECLAVNRGGNARANVTLQVYKERKTLAKGLTTGEYIIVAVFVGLAIVLFALIFCLLRRIRKERKEKKELDFLSKNLFERGYVDIFNPSLPLKDQVELLPYKQQFEFPKERLKLGKTLGQGAFGRVVKAEAIGLVEGEASTTVAVKMLKEAADSEQRKALIAELKIFIHIGRHLNIVNLLGAVTKNISKGELMVIVEYCCYGNLRHYLLKHKTSFVNQLDAKTGHLDPQLSTLPGTPFIDVKDHSIVYSNVMGKTVHNPSYGEQSLHYADLAHGEFTNDSGTGVSVLTGSSERYLESISAAKEDEDSTANQFLTTCDLLCFAFQCARGMEYLASRKLIHRDLAARNVLLAKDNIVKICDFGLAKDCCKYSNYVKKTKGLLPIKWMAIESIRDRVFTSKSDVWSFGVLLWEIFSMGGNPYPGFEINEEFFKKLTNGYRMEKPEYSPETIYQLMQDCWEDDPHQRPDFTTLAEKIGTLLETGVRKYYVELNAPYQMLNDELSNNNDYLQMNSTSGDDVVYSQMTDGQSEDIPLSPAVRRLEEWNRRQKSTDDSEAEEYEKAETRIYVNGYYSSIPLLLHHEPMHDG